MKIKQVAKLLNKINIPTYYAQSTIEEVGEQGENIYLLRKINNRWEFAFSEPRSEKMNIEKVFIRESEASKYYYLHQLNTYFFLNYVLTFELENKDINIGEQNCSINNLREAFDRLGIDNSYYGFDEPMKPHSVNLVTVNSSESKVRFIDRDLNIIIDAPPIENWLAYYNVYSTVYKLYLFDQHNKFLLDTKEIEEPFSDEDYKVVLS